MLKAVKILGSLIFLLLVAGLIVYLLPTTIKVKGMEALTGIVPASVKEKADEFLLTPAEKRSRILAALKSKLHKIESQPAAASEVTTLAEESQALITQLSEHNGERSFVEIAKEKLVEKLVGETKTQCTPQAHGPQ